MADPHTTRQDALTLLEEEHRAVEKLFDAFKRAADDDLERKTPLVQRACELLSMHAIVEEEILYPAAKEALGKDDKNDVNEAYVEHFPGQDVDRKIHDDESQRRRLRRHL